MDKQDRLLCHRFGASEEVKMRALVAKFDELYVVASEKGVANTEEQERLAIRSDNPYYCDYYIMLVLKLRAMIVACESRASGLVAENTTGGFRQFYIGAVRDESLSHLRKTKISALVVNAIEWGKKQIPILPFADAMGSVIQALVSIKDERSKYLGVFNVAKFAAVASIDSEAGVQSTIERFARIIVRREQRLGKKEEFGKLKKRFRKWVIEPGDTRARAEACIIADSVLECLMKPKEGCPVQSMIQGTKSFSRMSLDEALASLILGCSVAELPKSAVVVASCGATADLDVLDAAGFPVEKNQAPADTAANVTALEEKVLKLEKKLSQPSDTKQPSQLLKRSANKNKSVGAGALQQGYMDYRDSRECKDKLSQLDGENAEQSFLISSCCWRSPLRKNNNLLLTNESANWKANYNGCMRSYTERREKAKNATTGDRKLHG